MLLVRMKPKFDNPKHLRLTAAGIPAITKWDNITFDIPQLLNIFKNNCENVKSL